MLAHAGVLLVTSLGGAIALVRIGWGRGAAAVGPEGPAELAVERPAERPS